MLVLTFQTKNFELKYNFENMELKYVWLRVWKRWKRNRDFFQKDSTAILFLFLGRFNIGYLGPLPPLPLIFIVLCRLPSLLASLLHSNAGPDVQQSCYRCLGCPKGLFLSGTNEVTLFNIFPSTRQTYFTYSILLFFITATMADWLYNFIIIDIKKSIWEK